MACDPADGGEPCLHAYDIHQVPHVMNGHRLTRPAWTCRAVVVARTLDGQTAGICLDCILEAAAVSVTQPVTGV